MFKSTATVVVVVLALTAAAAPSHTQHVPDALTGQAKTSLCAA